jgi:hypothetical protein
LIHSLSIEFRALSGGDLTDFSDAGSGVHDSLSVVVGASERARHGESTIRRSGGGDTGAFHSAMESDDLVGIDDLRHSCGHNLGDGSLSTERGRLLEFGRLARILFCLADKAGLSSLKSGLNIFFAEHLVNEFDRVGVGQVVVQLSSRLDDIGSVGVGHVSQFVITVMRHGSSKGVLTLAGVILLVSESSSGRFVPLIAVEISHHVVETIRVVVGLPELIVLRLLSGVH